MIFTKCRNELFSFLQNQKSPKRVKMNATKVTFAEISYTDIRVALRKDGGEIDLLSGIIALLQSRAV